MKQSTGKGAIARQNFGHRTTHTEVAASQSTMRPEADDAFRVIAKAVLPKWTQIRRACMKNDPIVSTSSGGKARSGAVKPALFKKILKEHGIVMTQDQFFHIHSHVDVNLKTGIKYDAFFKEVLGRGKQ